VSLSVFGSSATGAGKDELFELGYPSRDARADGAEGDLENVRDFLIRRVVHVEQGQRRAKGFWLRRATSPQNRQEFGCGDAGREGSGDGG